MCFFANTWSFDASFRRQIDILLTLDQIADIWHPLGDVNAAHTKQPDVSFRRSSFSYSCCSISLTPMTSVINLLDPFDILGSDSEMQVLWAALSRSRRLVKLTQRGEIALYSNRPGTKLDLPLSTNILHLQIGYEIVVSRWIRHIKLLKQLHLQHFLVDYGLNAQMQFVLALEYKDPAPDVWVFESLALHATSKRLLSSRIRACRLSFATSAHG